MPQAKKLQGWVTIRGPDSGTIVQDEDEWLDLRDHDDLAIWYQVTDASNVDTLTVQTSPVREAETFVTIATLSTAASLTPSFRIVTWADADVPLARHVRWKCLGRPGGSFSITFRVWVVASQRVRKQRGAMLAPSYRDADLGGLEDGTMEAEPPCGCAGKGAPDAIQNRPGNALVARVERPPSANGRWGHGPLLPPREQHLFGGGGGGGGPDGWGWDGNPLDVIFSDPCLQDESLKELVAELAALKSELKSELEAAQAELNCTTDDGSPCLGPGQKSEAAGEILAIQQQIWALKQKIANHYNTCCTERGGDAVGLVTKAEGLTVTIKAASNQGEVTKTIKLTDEQVNEIEFHFDRCWHRRFTVTGVAIDNIGIGPGHLEFHDIALSGDFLGAHLGSPNGVMTLKLSATVKAFIAGSYAGENHLVLTLSTYAHSNELNVDGNALEAEFDSNDLVLGYNALFELEKKDSVSPGGPFDEYDIELLHFSLRIIRLQDDPFIKPN